MEESNTNTTNTGSMGMSPKPRGSSKTKKALIWILVILLVSAAGIAGGYYLGTMNKKNEVDQAKQDAKNEADQQHTNNNQGGDQSSSTPSKTTTETTCNADELALKTEESAESGAGTIAYDLVFTNTGSRTCVLGGFPGVSLVNDNGNMIGSPAERATNYEEKTLTLAPNTSIKATVYTESSANFDEGECKAGATKFRVYPPNDTGYLSTASPVAAWCPGFMVSPVITM